MPKLYISSALDNYDEVICMQNRFRKMGFEIAYDWATTVKSGKVLEISVKDIEYAISITDCFLALLPGGPWAYIEMGLAYAHGASVILYHTKDSKPIQFYSLPGITNTYLLEDAICEVIKCSLKEDKYED